MCVCSCDAPKLYEKLVFAITTHTYKMFATETIYASSIFMYIYIYIHIYRAYDIVSMYMNISNKQDCAVTEHLCLERIHCPSHLSRFKYFFLPITSLVCVEREYKTCILLVESFCFLSGCHHARDYPCRTGVFV